jgi:voltage-gated potassium channel
MIFNKSILIGIKYQKLILATITILLIGSMFYSIVEGWGWIDSIYISVITFTTIGYGDFSPQTDLGKIFIMFYVVIGIGLMFTFINTLYLNNENKVSKHNHSKTEE